MIEPEYLRKHYAELSDEALMAVDRGELVELARAFYDEEIERRGLSSARAGGRAVNITIEQRTFTLGPKFDITAPGGPYYAEKSPFSFLGNVQLMAHGHVIAQLRRRWVPFFTEYDFEFSNGKVYHFRCEKFWKGVYSCEGGDQSYRLYCHRGYDYSVFQKERQTAAFTKHPAMPGKGAKYQMRMSKGANVVVVICLALTVAASERNTRAGVGNIGLEDRPFDESWNGG